MTIERSRGRGKHDWTIEEDRDLTARNFHISVLMRRASYILAEWNGERLTRGQAIEQLEAAARELAEAWDKERTYGQVITGDQTVDAEK